jgi:hypothetical protein
MDVRAAGSSQRGDLHQRCLARLSEILEMRLSTFSQVKSVRAIGRSKFHKVPIASLNHRNVLAQSGGHKN